MLWLLSTFLMTWVPEASYTQKLSENSKEITYSREFEDIPWKQLFNELLLLLSGNVVENSLNGMCALFVTADLNELVFDHLKNSNPLAHWAIVDQFLKEIVGILIHHNQSHVTADLI